MAKYIEFENDGETVNGKPEYPVKSKSGGNVLARLCWYPRWWQWVCEPAPNTVWSQDCLADMREYMLSLSNRAICLNGPSAPTLAAESHPPVLPPSQVQ